MKDKKRICLALANVAAEDAIMKVIQSKFSDKYEIAENVRSREALLSAINREKFDCLIMREDLNGNVDLIDLFKTIRSGNNNMQIIFLMTARENGDPFFVELFLFNIYDFIVLPDIRLDEIFGYLSKPRLFQDILRFLPIRAERIRNLIVEANDDMKAPAKLNEDGDIDEVFTVKVKQNQNQRPMGYPPQGYYPPNGYPQYPAGNMPGYPPQGMVPNGYPMQNGMPNQGYAQGAQPNVQQPIQNTQPVSTQPETPTPTIQKPEVKEDSQSVEQSTQTLEQALQSTVISTPEPIQQPTKVEPPKPLTMENADKASSQDSDLDDA